jgi:hypothetical protein
VGEMPSPAAFSEIMKEDQRQFLSLLSRSPARLTVEQVAWLLNCQPHDIPTLVAARLLKPLGDPPPNGTKYFATAEVLESVEDRAWLNRVTHTIQQFWLGKNRRRGNGGSSLAVSANGRRTGTRRLALA